jgi:hypothetical protein
MPRFFFDLHDDSLILDEQGVELPDMAAAHAQAVKGARELMCAEVGLGTLDLSHRIEVRTQDGAQTATINFGDVLTVVGGDAKMLWGERDASASETLAAPHPIDRTL